MDYFVKDINLCDWGRKEISISEYEMPVYINGSIVELINVL